MAALRSRAMRQRRAGYGLARTAGIEASLVIRESGQTKPEGIPCYLAHASFSPSQRGCFRNQSQRAFRDWEGLLKLPFLNPLHFKRAAESRHALRAAAG